MIAGRAARSLVIAATVVLSACAGRLPHLTLPSGPGRPWPEAAAAWKAATADCRGVRTISAEMGLSGRAGRQRIRGRALVGLGPEAIRLEGLAPLGAPAFILVATADGATLLLPRDSAVLHERSAAPVLEALVGVALAPDDLRAILTGCVVVTAEPQGGRTFDAGRGAVDLPRAVAYLRQEPGGRWRPFAARRDGWQVEYTWGAGRVPDRVRLWREQAGSAPVDLSAALAQVELNVGLGPEVFRVDVPRAARPITLDELRAAGPLGAPRGQAQ